MKHLTGDHSFWQKMNELASSQPIIVDRSKVIAHPRYPDAIYPLDYGYLDNTESADGSGIDVWLGSLNTKTLTGILCVFDTLTCEMEIKLLIACSKEDIRIIQQFHSETHILYIQNPTEN